ncbi:hypothetical protein [Portibacter lacus]|uniref:Uncharacterized protein n=1 Tax=Portibacter lacus TaxID=1099794 RepID=A0AA37WDE5_9BACT|nr:hypothetical protein [Portibacter lacus]GLR15882.1 hypothetical protein GCM10007940_04970 [Portibacter lacus]
MNNGIKLWDIVHYLGVILLFIAITIGLLFITKGNLAMSIGGGVLISAVFVGLVEWLKSLKTANEFQDKKRLKEYIVLLGAYGVAFLLTFPIVLHFLNVNIGARNEIKNALIDGGTYLKNMVSAYEVHVEDLGEQFDTEIKVALQRSPSDKKAFIKKYKLNGIKESSIDVFVNSMKTKLLSELASVRSVYDDQTLALKKAADSFNPLAVPSLYHDMQIKSAQLRDELTRLSKSTIRGNESPFVYMEKDNNLGDISDPRALFPLTDWLYTILAIGLLHFMLLSSYIFENRAANTLVDSQGGRETGFRM